jgi:hypothetical protein
MTKATRRLSRRSVLRGAALGAGAATLAACGADGYDGPGIYAERVHRVPVDDPDAGPWQLATVTSVALGPQDVAMPQQLAPVVAAVRVSALRDSERLAFRLEWDDAGADDLTVRVDDYRDACAVLLAAGVAGGADAAVRTMGSAVSPATLLHWKADWQRDVERGHQGLDAAFPNRSVDVYPIVYGEPARSVGPETYVRAGATQWLPGLHVGNPISAATRASAVEKAIAHGFSTTSTAPSQDAVGRGVRTDRGWRVIVAKPLGAADPGEVALVPGTVVTCAFAVWSGQAHQAGSRKAPSLSVYALHVGA